jgi:L-ribulokinase
MIPDSVEETKGAAEDVIVLGIDFTACTMLPVDVAGQALCSDPHFAGHPHAWSSAGSIAPRSLRPTGSTKLPVLGEAFLERYGGKISSEWLTPKILQIPDQSPEVYDAAARFVAATDWVVLLLTGEERRNVQRLHRWVPVGQMSRDLAFPSSCANTGL